MRTILIVIFTMVILVMLVATVQASLDSNVLTALEELWPDPWFRATLADAAGAEIQVTDFGIAHLVHRQAHCRTGGCDRGVGMFAPEPVEDRCSRLRDGIIVRLLAVAPAVENQQCDGSWLCHCVLR